MLFLWKSLRWYGAWYGHGWYFGIHEARNCAGWVEIFPLALHFGILVAFTIRGDVPFVRWQDIFSYPLTMHLCRLRFLRSCRIKISRNDGVENRTSRGTAWFLVGLTWITLFFGGLAGGTGFLVKSKRLQTFISNAGEKRLSYIHRGLSFLTVLTGWVKVCLAPVALFGFCREAHTGQCIAHGIMGSAFVLYGFIYVLVLVIPWIRSAQTSYSQDYVDSWVMCIWGVVNTFTEHRWGREGWSVHDYQHTFMGIIWWTGGILGIFLSRNGRRTFVQVWLLFSPDGPCLSTPSTW